MANANSTICICGIEFAHDEVFGPAALRSMFGDRVLPLRVNRDGSIPVLSVAHYLREQGEIGMQRMIDESEIVRPRHARACHSR